jgi:hypothetical protein
MSQEDDAAAAAEPGDTAKVKATKAEKLEAKAARLREAEQERAARAAARVEAGEPAARSRGLVVALVVAAVLVVGLTAALVASLWHSSTLSDHQRSAEQKAHRAEQARQSLTHELQQARSAAAVGNLALGQSAVTAARSYAGEFGSYDYRHLDADFAKVAAHLTPQFKTSYIASSSKLKPAIEQVKGVAVGSVRAAGLVSATDTTALVAVFLDQKVTTSQSSTPRIDRNRLLVSLVKSGDTWLISKLTSP